tara:strand:- start:86360 stop:87775 length:1416 start_codon:yes stop_codon:yes gene_type:complete
MKIKEILPTKYFWVAILLTFGLVTGLMHRLWLSHSVLQNTQSQFIPILELSGIILKLDEKMNHMVTNAAYSKSMENRTFYDSYENAFDVSLQDLESLLNEYYSGQFHIDLSRKPVVALEKAAYEKIKLGQYDQALKLLESEDYMVARAEFLEYAQGLVEELNQDVQRTLQESEASVRHSFFVLLLFLLFSFVVWLWLFKTLQANFSARQRLAVEVETQRAKSIETSKLASLGEMAGGIAHEINNPLAIIEGRAHNMKRMLNNGTVDVELMNKSLNSIMSTTGRIHKTVRALLTIARSGDEDPLEMVPINRVIEDTLEMLGRKIENHQISLRVTGDLNCVVRARWVQLSQVILNLAQNAFHAVDGHHTRWIQIHIKKRQDWVEIRVSDSGPGVPEAIRNKIMEPFFTTKGVGHGTGLGLSISMSIIEDHGGRLYLDETEKHTTFVVLLPGQVSEQGSDEASDESLGADKQTA